MIYELHNAQQAKVLMNNIWPEVKNDLMAGHKMRLEVKRATRSSDQNDMFHAIIHQIYLAMRVAGSTWSADDWKRLLIDQWAHETDRKIGKVAPSLDGQRVAQGAALAVIAGVELENDDLMAGAIGDFLQRVHKRKHAV